MNWEPSNAESLEHHKPSADSYYSIVVLGKTDLKESADLIALLMVSKTGQM